MKHPPGLLTTELQIRGTSQKPFHASQLCRPGTNPKGNNRRDNLEGSVKHDSLIHMYVVTKKVLKDSCAQKQQ